jgi:hypothetical protein
MATDFFPARPDVTPTVYAYALPNSPDHAGLLKVGYTERDAKTRVTEQTQTAHVKVKIVLEESAMRSDGSCFTDHDIHRRLKKARVKGEWFRCGVKDVKAAVLAVRERRENTEDRTQAFRLRPEQQAAIDKTADYYAAFRKDNPDKPPRFLWNAKMRFGKTFAAYQLAKRQNCRKVLILTFKPAVQSAWEEDLRTHIDFEGWQFISRDSGPAPFDRADLSRPIVCFGSFQDYLGRNEAGGIKAKNEWVHATNWDLVIFDEYHFGAWREHAKELFEAEDAKEQKLELADDAFNEAFADSGDEGFLPITTGAYLYLSGTPFRAITTGEFIEEQIFNWTYSDEQKAKTEWEKGRGDARDTGESGGKSRKTPSSLVSPVSPKSPNPYAALPRMVLLTYQLPDAIRAIAARGEFDEFDLNEFFSAEGKGGEAVFKHQDDVQKWLDLIRGAFAETTVDNLKLGAKKPPLPFADSRLLSVLTHTFWFLPSVASCHAMRNLLEQRQNTFYHDYAVVVCAGAQAGIGVAALEPVRTAMGDPLKTKTITLSCGKLTTGVTVKPWSGILMLRNLQSPETYFQAAFRVQSPWTVDNSGGDAPARPLIVKAACYVFDFAPDRALRQIADYACKLNVDGSNPEKRVEEFIRFLPVLAYDGSSMKQIDAAGILDIAMSGTSATLLAKRWESALLVNVDNTTLRRLMDTPAALDALMRIEGFRTLNQDIATLINKSEAVKKAKKEADGPLTKAEKKELSDEEREYKSLRKQIQEKLVKFAARIPVFMYLTDYREWTLRDVITKLEPGLFKKVTGLDIEDFELLVSLNVFNSALMNDAVYKFKRYEDSSLSYSGVNRHEGEKVGLYDTVIPLAARKK